MCWGWGSSVLTKGRAGLTGVESFHPPQSNYGPAAGTQNRNLDTACLWNKTSISEVFLELSKVVLPA